MPGKPRPASPASVAELDVAAIRAECEGGDPIDYAAGLRLCDALTATRERLAEAERVADVCKQFWVKTVDVEFEEVALWLEGKGPDPFHKECRAQLAAAQAERDEQSALARCDTGELWSDECERARRERDAAQGREARLISAIVQAVGDLRRNRYTTAYTVLTEAIASADAPAKEKP